MFWQFGFRPGRSAPHLEVVELRYSAAVQCMQYGMHDRAYERDDHFLPLVVGVHDCACGGDGFCTRQRLSKVHFGDPVFGNSKRIHNILLQYRNVPITALFILFSNYW